MQDNILTLQKKNLLKTKLQNKKVFKNSKKHYFAILKRNKHKNCKKIQNFGLMQQEKKSRCRALASPAKKVVVLLNPSKSQTTYAKRTYSYAKSI